MPTLATSIQHSTGSPSQNNRQKKEITGIQVRKEKIKLSLLADEIILNTENPKDSTRKPELINKFSKLAG